MMVLWFATEEFLVNFQESIVETLKLTIVNALNLIEKFWISDPKSMPTKQEVYI